MGLNTLYPKPGVLQKNPIANCTTVKIEYFQKKNQAPLSAREVAIVADGWQGTGAESPTERQQDSVVF